MLPAMTPVTLEHVPPIVFSIEGGRMLRRAPSIRSLVFLRRFKALFGSTPQLCSLLWSLLADLHPLGGFPRHLLWALMFLKLYSTEHVHSTLAGVDEKSFRKWCWRYVSALSQVKLVCI